MNVITKENIIKICGDLGSEYKKDSQGNLIFNTSICKPNGDSWKLYFYYDPDPSIPNDSGKRFVCYTTGESFDVIELVLRNFRLKGKNLTYFQALNYVATQIGFKHSEIGVIQKSQTISDLQWINKLLSHKSSPSTLTPSTIDDETVLEVFGYIPIQQWLDEGISLNTQQKYQISYYARDNAIVIPHRDINNRLIGIRKRNLDPDQIAEYGKYNFVTVEHHMYKFRLGTNLFGLGVNLEAINRIGKLIIFEAEKSVLLADSYYNTDSFAVATCGSQITATQYSIIKNLNIREVFLAFDKEFHEPNSFEAEAYKNKLIGLLAPLMNWFTCYIVIDYLGLTDYKDAPVDCGKEVFSEILKHKILVTSDMVKEAQRTH